MPRQITPIAQPFELSPEGTATQKGLNQAIQKLNEAWEIYDAETDSLKGTDLSEDTARRFAQTAHELGQLGIDLLVRERALRLKMADHFKQLIVEHQTALSTKHRLLEEAKADVKKKLEKIGYSEEIKPGFARPSLTPGLIMVHPTVAQCYAEDVAIGDLDGGQRNLNDDALSKIDHEIEKIRRELVSRVKV